MRSALSLSAFLRCWRTEWPGTEVATGAIEAGTLRVAFDPRLKLACHGSPSARVQEDLNIGRLVVANPLRVETDSSYFLTYPRERSHLRRIKALEDWITLA